MSKLTSIQALRGIAALGVVAFHSLTVEQKYSGGDHLLPSFMQLGQSGVDLFFVISGYVMVTVTKGRFARTGEMMRFLWGRLTRIYPTYWFYFFVTGAIFLVKPNWVNSSQAHQSNLISSFLLLPSDRLPLVMVAWSLIHELWFYCVFAVLLKFHERWLFPALLSWAGSILLLNLFISVADLSAGSRIALHPYSIEFIVGALVAIYISKENLPQLSRRNAALTIAFVLAIGMPTVYMFEVLKDETLTRVAVVGALYGLLVLSVSRLETLNCLKVPKFLQSLGDMSYTVYLSHVLVLSAVGRLWLATSPMPNNLLDNWLASTIMLASVVGFGWVGFWMVEQPVLRASHRLRARWFDKIDANTVNSVLTSDAAK